MTWFSNYITDGTAQQSDKTTGFVNTIRFDTYTRKTITFTSVY